MALSSLPQRTCTERWGALHRTRALDASSDSSLPPRFKLLKKLLWTSCRLVAAVSRRCLFKSCE